MGGKIEDTELNLHSYRHLVKKNKYFNFMEKYITESNIHEVVFKIIYN